MERVGNARANAYWEATLPPDVRPPGDNVEAMTKFIRQKYEFAKWADPDSRPPHLPEGSGRRRRRHRPQPAAEVELADPFDSLETPQIRADDGGWPDPEVLGSVPRESRRWTDRAIEGIVHIKEVVVSKIDELFDRRKRDDHIIVGEDGATDDFGFEVDPLQHNAPLFQDTVDPPKRRRRHKRETEEETGPPEVEPPPVEPPPVDIDDLIGLEEAPAAPPPLADLLDLAPVPVTRTAVQPLDDLLLVGTPAAPSPPVDDLLGFGGQAAPALGDLFAVGGQSQASGAFMDRGLGPMMPQAPPRQQQQWNFGVARPPPPPTTGAREIFGTAPPPPPPRANRFAGLNPF